MQQVYKHIELPQGTEEWLAYRKNKIGASDAAPILGMSPWASAYDLWCEKMGVKRREKSQSMSYGNKMEEEIRDRVISEMKIFFSPCVIESIQNPWQIASLDGLSDNGNLAIEIKCANSADHYLAFQRTVPKKYIPQLQHQMSCLGLDFIFYVSYNKEDLRIFPVERDEAFIKNLIQKEKEFYDSLQNFLPPDFIDKDYINRDDDSDLKTQIQKYLEVKDLKKQYEEEEKKTREKILELCNNRNTTCNGVKVNKIVAKGKINYENIQELKNVNLDQYRGSDTIMWRIS